MTSPGEPSGSKATTRLLDPASLGFVGDEETGWQRSIRGQDAHFRILCSLDDLVHAERLQEEVFGVTERDLIPANELIVVRETGGAVIAAFLSGDPTCAAGVLLGWGGFVRRPRIVSDFLAVRAEARNVGLATELKRLQAGIASSRGFEEIVWTVDPLRAANARLNFGKLGAVARTYEIDRYGSKFATSLYGGMPSDRLHVTWDLTAPRVVARLLGHDDEFSAAAPNPPRFTAGTNHDTVIVTIPGDIDALLAADTAAALSWRFRLRDTLIQAFTEGLAITGFRPAADGDPAYFLERIGGQRD